MNNIAQMGYNKYNREIYVKTKDGWACTYRYKTDEEGFEVYKATKETFLKEKYEEKYNV